MNFFTTRNSTNIIVTLRIVTIEESELKFLMLYFHDWTNEHGYVVSFQDDWLI